MAKNDYFVITYQILTYLYECFKAGERPDTSMFGADALKINNGYWVNIMESLHNEGFITGIAIVDSAGVQGIKLLDLKITKAGIELLHENTLIAKAKSILKTARETIPGM